MKKYCLLGETLKHSYSKEIHEKFGVSYSMRELSIDKIAEFIKEDFDGFNITIPYKKEIIKYLDFISDEAKAINSVNTVVKKDGKLFGYTTDVFGMEKAIEKKGYNLSGKVVMILGSGGTKEVAYYLAKKQGAKRIIIVSRKGDINYGNFYEQKDVQVIINTTPVGTYPNEDECLVDLNKFKEIEFVFDCIYNPVKTELILRAEELGILCSSGLDMLVYQGAKSEEIWGVNKVDEKLCEKVIKDLNLEKKNIVIEGMPSSGKTLIGGLLAQKTGKKFIDSDDEIEKFYGKKPSDIISSLGEKKFREIEEEVIKNVCLQRGVVIALGGGVPISKINRRRLKRNSVVVWVKRDLRKLILDDRPLSQEKGVYKLYEERKNIYKEFCDFEVENNGEVLTAVKEILNYENTRR